MCSSWEALTSICIFTTINWTIVTFHWHGKPQRERDILSLADSNVHTLHNSLWKLTENTIRLIQTWCSTSLIHKGQIFSPFRPKNWANQKRHPNWKLMGLTPFWENVIFWTKAGLEKFKLNALFVLQAPDSPAIARLPYLYCQWK